MKTQALLSLCAVFLLFGCSAQDLQSLEQSRQELETTQQIFSDKPGSQQIYDKIDEGMSMAEVRTIAGEPLKVQQLQSGGTEIQTWYYPGTIQVMFWDGYARSKAKY